MVWFRKKEKREVVTLEDLILMANVDEDNITREMALNIPTLEGCIELISNTIATLPIKLFKEENGQVKEVFNDNRVNLLNDDTKDTLDGFQPSTNLMMA